MRQVTTDENPERQLSDTTRAKERERREVTSDAFRSIVDRNGRRLVAVARAILGNEDEARDAVQEALLSAYRALPTFEDRSGIYTWLYRITVNASLMQLRSKRRARLVFVGDAQLSALCGITEIGGYQHIERQQTRNLVRRQIAMLREPQRSILRMRYVSDLDVSEIAKKLGVNSKVVKVRLHRARRSLLILLSPSRRNFSCDERA